uniref:Variable lymphocyte receptor A n=1 Tax=Eptatretus stoutii TaxID=7765 RepID=Q2YE52_EPTST|nr:variable lymphocyte receptor A [Eptatretus stoutii]
MMGPVLAACLLIILSTAWISQANGATCKKDGGVCTCNDQTKNVDCSSKELTAIPSNIPTDTDRLVLNYNKLRELEPKAFHNLNKLTFLSLDSNQLQTLPPGVFDNLAKLTRLELNINQLRRVPEGAFDFLSSLSDVTLTNNPWDCTCNDILYMAKWLKKKQDEGLGGVDTAGCEEGGKAVLEITEEEAAEDCVYPNTTTAIPTTIITTLASSNDDDIPELPVPQENFQKFLGYQEPDHLPTQPQCLMSISGYLGLMMSLVLTSAAILYVIHFLKKA